MSHSALSMKSARQTIRGSIPFVIAAAAGLAASVQAAGPESTARPFHQSESESNRIIALPKVEVQPSSQQVLSDRIIVHVNNMDAFSSSIESLQSTYPGLKISSAIDRDLGVYLVNAGSIANVHAVRNSLMSQDGVHYAQVEQARETPLFLARQAARSARNLMMRNRVDGAMPFDSFSTPRGGFSTDPLFGSQWHFVNPVPTLPDNNILSSIYSTNGLSGQGITIGFTNEGVNTHIDTDHTELDGNYLPNLSMEFDPVLFPDDSVMTSIAGIVSAEIDGVGLQGIAPNSSFATYNWPNVPDSIPLHEFEAYDWKYRDIDIKMYDMGGGFFAFPQQAYNPGSLNSYIQTPLRNSFAFGRNRRGTVNIFSSGMNLWAVVGPGVPALPDPYFFPPAMGVDHWSPIDAWGANQNEISISLTNGYTSGPFYPNGQLTYYPPANDRRSLIFNTVAEDGYPDVYAAQGSSMFASFYGATTNQFLATPAGQPVPTNVLAPIPGASNFGTLPGNADPFPSGSETMSGAAIGAATIALMIEANPTLKIRDIQHILFESIQESTALTPAEKWPNFDTSRSYYFPYAGDPAFAPPRSFWQINDALYTGGTVTNQAIRHSDIYGFGVVDVDLAIQKAATWGGTPNLVLLDSGYIGTFSDPTIDTDTDVEIEIADAAFVTLSEADGSIGLDGAATLVPGTSASLPDICVRQNIQIEAIVLELTIQGDLGQDLYIQLVSPHGTTSILHIPTTNNLLGTTDPDIAGDDDAETTLVITGEVNIGGDAYAWYRHPFLTWKHWGELSGGVWDVSIVDYGPDTAPPEGEEMGTGMMPDPGADMVVSLGEVGLPGNGTRSEKTITGYRFQIYGTDTGLPIFEGCELGATSCPADLDGNGIIDVRDLQIYISYYLDNNAIADLDGDGQLTYNDLVIFRGLWQPGFCGDSPFTGSRPRPGNTDAGDDNNPQSRPI
jgi:hypothetical protein